MLGDGRAQVIHGNYDTYERMRALQAELSPQRPRGDEKPRESARASAPKPAKRKRRFPYRKTEEIEADIAATETRLRELEEQMASPELYRDGDRVKETTRAFEEVKAQLAQLYEHWEEAVELN